MKPYDQLTSKGKFIRKNVARLLMYGLLAIGYIYGLKAVLKETAPAADIRQV